MPLNVAQTEQIYKAINPNRVQTRQGKFSYLETWDVIAHLTRVFSISGWDKEVDSDLLFETESNGKWTVAYRAKCRLTIRDPNGDLVCVHEDVATGSAINQPSRGDAHDLALKTAVSDALKRAAKDLGNQWGLSLYSDGSTESVVSRSLADIPTEGPDPRHDPKKVRTEVAGLRDRMLGERPISEADAAQA
jgi:recombination DNA repair RAD52 pathway protein